jgi:hypothetical protein
MLPKQFAGNIEGYNARTICVIAAPNDWLVRSFHRFTFIVTLLLQSVCFPSETIEHSSRETLHRTRNISKPDFGLKLQTHAATEYRRPLLRQQRSA